MDKISDSRLFILLESFLVGVVVFALTTAGF